MNNFQTIEQTKLIIKNPMGGKKVENNKQGKYMVKRKHKIIQK